MDGPRHFDDDGYAWPRDTAVAGGVTAEEKIDGRSLVDFAPSIGCKAARPRQLQCVVQHVKVSCCRSRARRKDAGPSRCLLPDPRSLVPLPMKAKEAFPPEDEFDVEEETAAEAAADAAASPLALALPPPGLSEDEQAQWWLKNVYRAGSMRQLTVRSVVAGMLIGALMAISNLYVGLKTGWGLGVTITACVIAFAVFKSLEAILPWLRKNPLTMLENCSLLSTASAAGAISSAGLVSAIPALYLCTGQPMGIVADDGLAGVGGHAGAVHGGAAEAPTHQHRQAAVSLGHRHGRNPQEPPLDRRQGDAASQDAPALRAVRGLAEVHGGRVGRRHDLAGREGRLRQEPGRLRRPRQVSALSRQQGLFPAGLLYLRF